MHQILTFRSAATWLSRCGVDYKVLERSSGPMERGQADGVQCRTVEIFESFGLSEEMLRDAFHILEVAFWQQDNAGKLARTRRTADTAPGLTHMPHVILNQAIVNGLLLGSMKRSGGKANVEYGVTVKGIQIDEDPVEDEDAYPCKVTAEKEGKEVTYNAKYVLVSFSKSPSIWKYITKLQQGCDGAHSQIRKSLGYQMVGDSTNSIWGVMDVYVQTDFPDIRRKSTLHTDDGALLIIPREGGSLVRFYIELPHGTQAKEVKLEDLQAQARKMFRGYTMEFSGVYWWSAYSIGQRLADHFSKNNRVFLTGDACHTHSPKAGQGMNVSLQDGYNMGWKLAYVLRKQASPGLLKTYNIEREKTAADLIQFDREWTKVFSVKVNGTNGSHDSNYFSDAFIKAGKYTAGLTAKYDDSSIISEGKSTQSLATNIEVGMRFPSQQVVRLCDAKAMQIVRGMLADSRWRIVIFAGDIRKADKLEQLRKIGAYLDSDNGPVRRATRKNADIDSVIEPLIVLSGKRVEMEQEWIPDYFWPPTGQWKMRDVHKTFVDDDSYNSGHGHAYERWGVDPSVGCIVIVRPDHYVSLVTGLDDHQGIGRFFEGFLLPQT